MALATNRTERGSGVAPSRLRTRYLRSYPVAMLRLTSDEDRTARASRPGVMNSTVTANSSVVPKKTSSPTGMISVSSTASPRRRVRINSSFVWARRARAVMGTPRR